MAKRYVLPIARLCVWDIRGSVGYPSVALLKPLELSNSNKPVGGTVRTARNFPWVAPLEPWVAPLEPKRLKGGSSLALVAGFDNAVDPLAFGMNEVATEHSRLFAGSGYELECYPRTA